MVRGTAPTGPESSRRDGADHPPPQSNRGEGSLDRLWPRAAVATRDIAAMAAANVYRSTCTAVMALGDSGSDEHDLLA